MNRAARFHLPDRIRKQLQMVSRFLVVSNDLHETWNDLIAVLRTRHGEIFISTNDMLLTLKDKKTL